MWKMNAHKMLLLVKSAPQVRNTSWKLQSSDPSPRTSTVLAIVCSASQQLVVVWCHRAHIRRQRNICFGQSICIFRLLDERTLWKMLFSLWLQPHIFCQILAYTIDLLYKDLFIMFMERCCVAELEWRSLTWIENDHDNLCLRCRILPKRWICSSGWHKYLVTYLLNLPVEMSITDTIGPSVTSLRTLKLWCRE